MYSCEMCVICHQLRNLVVHLLETAVSLNHSKYYEKTKYVYK